MKTKTFLSVLMLALCYTLAAQKYDPGSGKTVLLIGQTWQQEFQDYVSGVKPPGGSSHYGEIYSGEINQGNDAFGNGFLTYMNNTYPGAYALIAISIKDNPGAGGFGDTYSALQAINSGNLDTQIDKIAQTFADHSNLKFYVRLGYEVSLYMFAPGGDTQAYINAYNRMAKRIRAIAKNVDFVYHPVRGFNDTRDLYPGDEYVDFVGFSVFNNDICLECNGTFNCQGSQVDPNLQQSMDFAKQKGKPIIIAESAVQSPAAASVSGFNDYLDRLFAVVENNDVRALAYINSDWNSHGWGPEWGDSRVEKNSAVLSHWNSYVNKPRYIHYNGSTAPSCSDGIKNQGETGIDCGGPCPACTNGPTCSDGIQNGDEEGVDCGGSCPNSCGTSGTCKEFGVSYVNDNTIRVYHKDNGWSAQWQYVCLDGYCVAGEKKDGYYYKDFKAALGQQYTIQFKAEDNATGQYLSPEEKVTFTKEKCSFVVNDADPTCTDGVQNGGETGVDCGGPCPACTTGPTCSDGIQNGDETGIDCGGSCPNSCAAVGEGNCGEFGISHVNDNTVRVYHKDNGWSASWQYVCLDGYCVTGEKKDGYYYKDFDAALGQQYEIQFKAQDNATGQYLSPVEKVTFTKDKCSFTGGTEPTCTDGIQNGDETGVDCGGSCPNACSTGPTCNDGVQNGDETGVDCGGSCPPCGNGNDPLSGAKLLPPGKKILLSIGQDLKTEQDYINGGVNQKGFPVPGAVVSYNSFHTLEEPTYPQYGALGEAPDGTPYNNDINWGAGPLNARNAADGYPESALVIALNIADGGDPGDVWCSGCISQIGGGAYDTEIKALAAFCKRRPNEPIYLRIGFEFDGKWNLGYSNTGAFKSAWRRIVDVMRGEGVNNVAYVWQSCASPIDDILEKKHENIQDWWPGDDYVDWLGLSWFMLPGEKPLVSGYDPHTQKQLADEVVSLARSKKKPVMIAESTPQGYDLTELKNCHMSPIWDGDAATGCVSKSAGQIWDEWFVPYFDYIYANKDVIRHVTYINVNWEDDTDKFGPGSNYAEGYWGRAGVHVNSTIANNWKTEITKSVWMHGGDNNNSGSLKSINAKASALTSVSNAGKIGISPVPATDEIILTGVDATVQYKIYTVTGMQVEAGQGTTIDVNKLKPGMYILTTDENQRVRFIKN